MKALLTVILVVGISTTVFAKKKKMTKVKATPEIKNLNLKTEVDFSNGANVLGNYESMSEADVAVEGEKKRIDIVEPRKNWDLKTKASKEWH